MDLIARRVLGIAKKAPTTHDGVDLRGKRIFGGRGLTGVEWVAGRPVTRSDPSDRNSVEQLVRTAPHG